MIYPEYFPLDDENNKGNPERIVFEALKPLANKYEIFYSRRIKTQTTRKTDHEIDFLIIDPDKAILVLEVKGGFIQYDGKNDKWKQNNKVIDSPLLQVLSERGALLERFPQLKRQIPVGWALCFPQCELQPNAVFPASLNSFSIIDEKDLLKIDKRIKELIAACQAEFPGKLGLNQKETIHLKENLLRDLGFVKRLSTRIERDEKIYLKLTNEQYATFKQAIDNDYLVVNGVAGSGKTIIAKELAKEFVNQGMNVLLLCFNRPICDALYSELRRYSEDKSLVVYRYHQFAQREINNEVWWKETLNACKQNNDEDDFWSVEVPSKHMELDEDDLTKYDAIIVDEGQDFKEFWYETIVRHVKPNGKFIVFLDPNQDIFNHYTELPKQFNFFKTRLDRNCRNGIKIVDYLKENSGIAIQTFKENPSGDYVSRNYKNEIEQNKLMRDDILSLVNNDGVQPNKILILIHSHIKESCLKEMRKVGNYEIKSAYNTRDLKTDNVMYATIEIFKGLEADVVLLADTHLIPEEDKRKMIYVEASRARHRLYVYEKV